MLRLNEGMLGTVYTISLKSFYHLPNLRFFCFETRNDTNKESLICIDSFKKNRADLLGFVPLVMLGMSGGGTIY